MVWRWDHWFDRLLNSKIVYLAENKNFLGLIITPIDQLHNKITIRYRVKKEKKKAQKTKSADMLIYTKNSGIINNILQICIY